MWKVSLQIVAKHPFGVGLGNFPGAYGDAQADRIAGRKVGETEKHVAGNPEYGFNEYLQIAVESGWLSFLLFLGMIACAFRSMWKAGEAGLAGSLAALLVFAFFSYPFSILPCLIVFILHAARFCALLSDRHTSPRGAKPPCTRMDCFTAFAMTMHKNTPRKVYISYCGCSRREKAPSAPPATGCPMHHCVAEFCRRVRLPVQAISCLPVMPAMDTEPYLLSFKRIWGSCLEVRNALPVFE